MSWISTQISFDLVELHHPPLVVRSLKARQIVLVRYYIISEHNREVHKVDHYDDE